MLLTEKIGQKNLIDRTNRKTKQPSNIFGLGLVSLIAACSSASNSKEVSAGEGDGSAGIQEDSYQGIQGEQGFTGARTLPFKPPRSIESSDAQGYDIDTEWDNVSSSDDDRQDRSRIRIHHTNDPDHDNDILVSLRDKDAKPYHSDEENIYRLTTTASRYDLIISMAGVESTNSVEENKGAILIYWDVTSIRSSSSSGSNPHLTIEGVGGDHVGSHAPEFLQLGGEDRRYDMFLWAEYATKNGNNIDDFNGEGAIFILWDVDKYSNQTGTIGLGMAEIRDPVNGATAGSLAIYGSRSGEQIEDPELFELGGKNDNYEMVFSSDTSVLGDWTYILWDIADYYSSDPTKKHKTIDLADPSDYSSGLLIIPDLIEIIYDAANGLTDIDNDAAGTYDIVLREAYTRFHTYILFGDKIASDENGDGKVDSKHLILDNIEGGAGFYSYDFENHTAALTTATAADKVLYRFEQNVEFASHAKVVEAYNDVVNSSKLSSDTEATAYWDIA